MRNIKHGNAFRSGHLVKVNWRSRWLSLPNLLTEMFENLGEDLSKIVIELIENENDTEKLKEYLDVLPNFLVVAMFDTSIVEPKQIWINFWRTLTQLIDNDSELTAWSIMTMSLCIDEMRIEANVCLFLIPSKSILSVEGLRFAWQ